MKIIIYIAIALLILSCNAEEKEANVTIIKPSVSTPLDESFISHYPNGKVKIKGEKRNGKRSGTWISYFQNGNKQSESVYANGLKNGKTVSYYQSGQIRYIGYYKNDKKDGTWDFYLKDGTAEKTVKF